MPGVGVRSRAGPGAEAEGGLGAREAAVGDDPGRNGRKFHLLPAAFSTSSVSIPIRLKISASSLISAMLTSRCVFSMTLAASATRMLEALCVPAFTIRP